ncbi:MAG: M17 family peptidase N-terminal domain-containing protein, partial [Pseudomonadota bacterium]
MTRPVEIAFLDLEAAPMAEAEGTVVVFTLADGALSDAATEADDLTGGAAARLTAGKSFKGKAGDVGAINVPTGMKAEKLLIIGLGDEPAAGDARKAGAAAAKAAKGAVTFYGAGDAATQAEVAFGFALRRYEFDVYKKKPDDDDDAPGAVRFASAEAEAVAKLSKPNAAVAEGVFFTRDLVNEPANVLTTGDFAARLAAME